MFWKTATDTTLANQEAHTKSNVRLFWCGILSLPWILSSVNGETRERQLNKQLRRGTEGKTKTYLRDSLGRRPPSLEA